MWIAKGIALGLALFSAETILYFYWHILRPTIKIAHTWAVVIDINLIRIVTIHNPIFWMALVGCLLLGCAIFGPLPRPAP